VSAPVKGDDRSPVNQQTTTPVGDTPNAPVGDGTNAPVGDNTNAPVGDNANVPAPVSDTTASPLSLDNNPSTVVTISSPLSEDNNPPTPTPTQSDNNPSSNDNIPPTSPPTPQVTVAAVVGCSCDVLCSSTTSPCCVFSGDREDAFCSQTCDPHITTNGVVTHYHFLNCTPTETAPPIPPVQQVTTQQVQNSIAASVTPSSINNQVASDVGSGWSCTAVTPTSTSTLTTVTVSLTPPAGTVLTQDIENSLCGAIVKVLAAGSNTNLSGWTCSISSTKKREGSVTGSATYNPNSGGSNLDSGNGAGSVVVGFGAMLGAGLVAFL